MDSPRTFSSDSKKKNLQRKRRRFLIDLVTSSYYYYILILERRVVCVCVNVVFFFACVLRNVVLLLPKASYTVEMKLKGDLLHSFPLLCFYCGMPLEQCYMIHSSKNSIRLDPTGHIPSLKLIAANLVKACDPSGYDVAPFRSISKSALCS